MIMQITIAVLALVNTNQTLLRMIIQHIPTTGRFDQKRVHWVERCTDNSKKIIIIINASVTLEMIVCRDRT